MSTAVTNKRGKTFYNQKFYGKSFVGEDLSHSDFRSATLIRCDFSDADLSYANFEGANCREAIFKNTRLYRANFKDAALADSIFEPKDAFGITLTMHCESFDGVKASPLWYLCLIMLTLRMECPEPELDLKLISAMDPERYKGFRVLFDRRQM